MRSEATDRLFEELVRGVRAYHPSPDVDLLRRAYMFAAEKHQHQIRKSGEPYILHPLEVTRITAELRLDHASLCAAILHDTVEDTDTSVEEISKLFSAEIAMLVSGLTKIAKLEFRSREEAQAENIRKLIIATGRDIRVVLIKLADRLHNIRTLGHMKAEGQQRIARETLEIYAPLANRLGISWMKEELEDTAFRYLQPEAHADLVARIASTRADRERYVSETAEMLRRLIKEAGIQAEIQGRSKHLYSIHKKMERSKVALEQIHDIIAFRVIVREKNACYEVFGIVHDRWKPVAGRFKDYIALPKPNGYRSLHTTVIGPQGNRIEIQIRTEEMHQIAEFGVAAHWAYKEGRAPLSTEHEAFGWLRQLVESQAEIADSREWLDAVRLDLFADEVFVFTPNGDIKALPQSSTPVDFAYAIHSEVGHHCYMAKVNGRVVPLHHNLVNGDTIEIVTRADQRPREQWLDFVRSSRARQRIIRFLRTEKAERAKELGRSMLAADLRQHGIRLEVVLKSNQLDPIAQALGQANVDQLFIALGVGSLQLATVVGRLIAEKAKASEKGDTSSVRRIGDRLRQMITGRGEPRAVRIAGLDGDLMVEFGRCCNPVPGEDIVGYITRGRGLSVHAAACSRLMNLEDERRVEVEWESFAKDTGDKPGRRVTVRVICKDAPGMLSKMSTAFSSSGVNISQAHCRSRDDGTASNIFDVVVHHLGQLNDAMNRVGKIEGVVSVERVRA